MTDFSTPQHAPVIIINPLLSFWLCGVANFTTVRLPLFAPDALRASTCPESMRLFIFSSCFL
jgi:hypothetical protein